MLIFSHSWAFVLLVLPVLVYWLFKPHREQRPAVRAPFMERLARLTGRQAEPGAVTPGRLWSQRLLLIAVWALLVTALARPQWLEEPIMETLPMRDLMLAVDISGSMSAEDFVDAEGNRSDRLTAVKGVLDEFLTRREGDRVGLILFGSSAFVQAPFTEDLAAARTLLNEAQVGMAGPKTALGDAIGLSISLFDRSEVPERVLILLTDGNDTSSLMPPDRAAEIARDKGVTLYTIGVGDPASVGEEMFDEETLKTISATTGGAYYHANNREELDAIYQELDALNPRQVETVSHRPWRELFQWPVGLALVLMLLFHAFMLARDWLRQRKTGSSQASPLQPGSASGSKQSATAAALLAVLGGLLAISASDAAAPAQALSAFHFLRPAWLLALAPAGLLLWALLRRRDARLAWRGVIAPHLLNHLLLEEETKRRKWRPEYLLGLGWLAAILATAGPSWRHAPAPFADDQAALAIVLKVTPSMLARDVQPSRLERSVHKIHDLLALRPGSRNALIAYSGSAHLVMPLTSDADIINSFAAELSPEIMPREGDAVTQALALADSQLKAAGQARSILLIADAIAPDQFQGLEQQRKAGGNPVSILAVAAGPEIAAPPGSPPAPALDMAQMKEAARAAGAGLTVVTPDGTDLDHLSKELQQAFVATGDDESSRWLDAGYYLLPLLALIALLWFRRGWVVVYE